MPGHYRSQQAEKGDRALKLYEQGLEYRIIAERLRLNPKSVRGMVQRARERREIAKERA